MSSNILSRRRFLQVALGTSAAVALAACGPKETPAPTTAPQQGGEEAATVPAAEKEAQPAPAEAKDINFLCRADIKPAYAADKAVEAWNAEFPSKITMDEPAAGVDLATKVQASQAAGDLIWDGFSLIEMPNSVAEWVLRGIISPLEDYIEASTIPTAKTTIDSIIPSIKQSVSFEGKQYGIPGNVGSVALAWMWDALRAAGYEEQPKTWDEVYDCAKKIKEAKPDLIPFGSANTPLCDLYTMIWGSTKDPIDADGLIDIRGEASIKALTWLRKMAEEELMPLTSTTTFQDWLKGGVGLISSYDVAGTMNQQTFGIEAADTGISFFVDEQDTYAGTPFWINSSVLFNKAENPQGMVDFYLWWFGPENKTTGKQIAEVAAKPCYTYTYDEFIKGRPEYEWEQKGIDLVAKSVWFPANRYYLIVYNAVQPMVQKAMDVDQEFTPEADMEEAYQTAQEEISKMK